MREPPVPQPALGAPAQHCGALGLSSAASRRYLLPNVSYYPARIINVVRGKCLINSSLEIRFQITDFDFRNLINLIQRPRANVLGYPAIDRDLPSLIANEPLRLSPFPATPQGAQNDRQ